MKLYIVIAVFNNKDITINCLNLLKKQSYNSYETVLVDDGSSDGTSEAVAEQFPEVHIIKGDGNWWWTKSINEGIRYSLKEGADAVLIMNNDTIFSEKYLETITHQLSENPGSVIGSIDITMEEPHKIFFSGVKEIIWWRAKEIRYHKGYDLYEPEKIKGLHKTVGLNGRGTLIPVEVFEKIGLYDEENLPQYASDYDFSVRSSKAGIPTYISWDAVLFSYVSVTGEGRPFIKQSLWKFLKSFSKKYSQTSYSTLHNYYKKHTKWYYFHFALFLQMLKLVYSFYKRRNTFQN